MFERDLRSGIAAIDYLIEQIDAGNSLPALRQQQVERKAVLQERLRLRLLTTCHCGQGQQDLEYPHLTHCYCHSKLIAS